MPHIIVIKNNKYLMFDECDNVYVNTFKNMYDVNYYEVIPNKDFTNLSFMPKNDIEK